MIVTQERSKATYVLVWVRDGCIDEGGSHVDALGEDWFYATTKSLYVKPLLPKEAKG